MNLVDTDVLVDCLRGTVPGQGWLKQQAQQPFAVPAVAAMELVMGCRDRGDLDRIQRFLATFEVVWPEAPEFAAAY
jgi:predicted nucleic acid-binding protein